MSEFYTVLYHNENIYAYHLNEEEVLIVEEFRQELIDICNDLDIPRGRLVEGSPYMGRLKDNYDFYIKYRDDIGYFVLCGERGKFSLKEGFPTPDRNEAKLLLLEFEFSMGGFQYELNSREILKKLWINKYSVDYDSRKEAFEFTIRKLNEVFNDVPERIVSYYTDCMNRWFEQPHWYFDDADLSFKEL